MNSVLSAPFAKFFKLNLPLNFFLVFARPIIDSFADAALNFY